MKLLILTICIVGALSAPLTNDEAQSVKDSWHKVSHNEIEILVNLFEKYPQHQARFPAFVGKDLATLKDTAKFATHATRIMSAMSEVIELSGNPETVPALKTILHTLGSDHKRRGIPKESFADFEDAFMFYMSNHYTGWNDGLKMNWEKAFTNSFEVMYESY